MSRPIRPSELAKRKQEMIPDEVFDAFNELIGENWNGSSARVLVKDVAERIRRNRCRNKLEPKFNNSWLNIEECYRKAGWNVEYDKPGFNESYEAFFEFSRQGS